MTNIVLKNRKGEDVTYSGIETVTFDTDVAGEQATFTHGVALSEIPIDLDLSGGDQEVSTPEGYLVRSAVIRKPEALTPENIRSGVAIAGVNGSFIGDTEEVTVDLALAEGDQTVEPSEDGKVISRVTIRKPETLLPENIAEGVDIAGVLGTLVPATAEVRYVTFMSYDGLVEYGKKAVAVGDDCADPIARGVFETPTRESDAQYNYTFYGWATTPNGAADSNWNKAITEDKTVYANFASAVRYYTITYYDSDGTTVLKTVNSPYGSTPSYKPEKDGFVFDGWSPDIAPVTGTAAYTASWSEKLTFADATWADIARIAESGEAANMFSIGDTKRVPVAFQNGRTYEVEFMIVDFDFDNLADGTGKAGISVVSVPAIAISGNASGVGLVCTQTGIHYLTSGKNYESQHIRSDVNTTMFGMLPADLRSVIKPVKKQSYLRGTGDVESEEKLWIVAGRKEINQNATIPNTSNYDYFTSDALRKKYARQRFGPTRLDIPGQVTNAQVLFLFEATGDCGSITHVGLAKSSDPDTKPFLVAQLAAPLTVAAGYVPLIRSCQFIVGLDKPSLEAYT